MNEKLEIVREDQEAVTERTTELIAEGEAAFEHILTLLANALKSISQHLENMSEVAKLHRAIVLLGARFYSSVEAGLSLLKKGLLLPACAMSRDMVEILVVVEYLQRHPSEAETFANAMTLKQRKRYGISGLSKQIPSGKTYKQHFDIVSAFTHPCTIASGAILRPSAGKTDKLYLGGYYQPYPIACELITQMCLSLELVFLLTQWYSKRIPWPFDQEQFRLAKVATLEYSAKLKDTAEREDFKLEKTLLFLKELSIKQMETLLE